MNNRWAGPALGCDPQPMHVIIAVVRLFLALGSSKAGWRMWKQSYREEVGKAICFADAGQEAGITFAGDSFIH